MGIGAAGLGKLTIQVLRWLGFAGEGAVMSYVDDPDHWLRRASSLRRDADQTTDDRAKAIMLQIANDHERRARLAAQHLNHSELLPRRFG